MGDFEGETAVRHRGRHAASDEPATIDDLALGLGEPPRRRGWRGAVRRLTGGAWDPGDAARDVRDREQRELIAAPVDGRRRIAVLAAKGGVGKTSVTLGLGATFAALRGDRVVAVDANPDLGTLADRMPEPSAATVRDLLRAPSTESYADVRALTSHSPSRLEVVGSERDPSVSEAFSAADYSRVLDIVSRHYTLILVDCGTGLVHPAMPEILASADCLVLVATPALDGARGAWATLDWLSAHGHGALVAQTVVAVNHPVAGGADDAELERLFGARCRATVALPFDPHLADGAVVDPARLRPATAAAFRELAAVVATGFPAPSGRHGAHAAHAAPAGTVRGLDYDCGA
ncbi:nucleotide-binding protein [Corynebacterium sp. 335C]